MSLPLACGTLGRRYDVPGKGHAAMHVRLAGIVPGRMTGLLWLVLGLLMSTAENARAAAHDEILALRHDSREVILLDRIIVNDNPRIRYVYINKCQRTGERELFDLTLNYSIEESFIYIPDLCVWIETGYSETQSAVKFDREFFDKIAAQYSAINVYHVHPGIHDDMVRYFPAYQDFIAMTLLNADYINVDGKEFGHRIVTGAAVMDYRFASVPRVRESIKKYVAANLGNYAAQNLAYEYSKTLHIEEYTKVINKCIDIANNNIDHIEKCSPVRTELFIIDIRSLKTFLSAPSD